MLPSKKQFVNIEFRRGSKKFIRINIYEQSSSSYSVSTALCNKNIVNRQDQPLRYVKWRVGGNESR